MICLDRTPIKMHKAFNRYSKKAKTKKIKMCGADDYGEPVPKKRGTEDWKTEVEEWANMGKNEGRCRKMGHELLAR